MDGYLDGLADDPHTQFEHWYTEAAAAIPDPERIALATATPDGVPSVRMVLLKGHDQRGYVFFTNHESRKGGELAANPRAAFALFWPPPVHRQIRVEGTVERLSDSESAAYHATRGRESQLGAWASPQSRPVSGRDELERLLAEIEDRFAGADIPLPPFWGGYRIVPVAFEFWEGREHRLHDRVRYERAGDRWTRTRLGP